MRTVDVLITCVEPFNCPAGYVMRNCASCIFRLGSITSSPAKGATVRCDWDEHEYEEQKEEKDG